MFEYKSTQFSGPLDLLLQLIEKQQLTITEISLSQITDEYLAYVEKLESAKPEDLADFLMVAARLLLIKSKALLPYLEQEEEISDLEAQLKMYKDFVDASKNIQALINEKRFMFSRAKAIQKTEVVFSPPAKLKINDLKDVFLTVLKRLDPLVKLPRQMIEKTVSLQQTIFDIKNFLDQQKKVGFKSIMSSAKSKTDVIINFLALLELVKQRHLKLKQVNNFEDIVIEKL